MTASDRFQIEPDQCGDSIRAVRASESRFFAGNDLPGLTHTAHGGVLSWGARMNSSRAHRIDSMVKLSQSEIASAVRKFSGWSVANGKLHRDYEFVNFVHAFGFMATAALMIEKMGHHPEWFNVYNRLSVDLATHDAGGITKKDIELAKKLETLAEKLI